MDATFRLGVHSFVTTFRLGVLLRQYLKLYHSHAG